MLRKAHNSVDKVDPKDLPVAHKNYMITKDIQKELQLPAIGKTRRQSAKQDHHAKQAPSEIAES